MTEPMTRERVDIYRVCQWCSNDSVDDPTITWSIKSPDKPIGLCDACAREVPEQWIQMVITDETTQTEIDE